MYLDISAEGEHSRRAWEWQVGGGDPADFPDYERPDLGQDYTAEEAARIEEDLRVNPMVRRMPGPGPAGGPGAG